MNKRIPLVLLLASLVLLYAGERALTETPRTVTLAAGTLALVAALLTAALRFVRSSGEARVAYCKVLAHYCVAAAACALYFAQTKDLALVPAGRMQTVVQVLWPALLLISLAPAIAMERAVASTERAGVVETYRVNAAARAARIVVLAIIAFAGINYSANVWNWKVDLSYFKTTRPSEATIGLVKSLTVPVEVLLFYPAANEVLDHVQAYTDELARASDRIHVRVVDQALEIELAKELKVRNNGVIVLRANGRNEQLKTEVELDNARNALKTLDTDFHNRLLKVVRPPRLAYFTSGHNERDYAVQSSDGRATLAELRTLLETQGFSVERLGLAEGLGTAVPENANLLIVAGPTQAFMSAELEAMRAYLARGGRMLVMVDPEEAAASQALADMLGVKIGGTPVASDKNLVRLQDRGESSYYWGSNNTAPHDSITTLNKATGRLPLVFITTGTVTKKADAPVSLTVSPTLRGMPDAWDDVNRNGKLDEGEKREVLDLAVAIEGSYASAKAEDGKEAPPLARVLVAGDSDLAATGILSGVPGNQTYFIDGVRWLVGEDKQVAGLPESEKDVPIVHRKEKDTIWFYGTSFLVPAAVLGLGLTASRRARRVKREVKE